MISCSSALPSAASAIHSAQNQVVDLRGLVKTFNNAAGEFTVLKGLDLQISRGEFVSIVGKSGSGKSTLMNMITGIDHPTAGQVFINGTNLYAMTESQRSLWRGRNLGIVFQFFQLLPMLTLLENVMLPMDYTNTFEFDERPRRALELLDLVGLADFAMKLPVAVSSGQQQSAAIARALATNPPLIMADEPTGNLDSQSAEKITSLFEELVRQGKTIAMVTHDSGITLRTSRNVIISDGELIDEAIAQALPLLSHTQMLHATKKLERQIFQPGQTILTRDAQVDHFCMISNGAVEIVLQGHEATDVVVTRLGRGQYFGDIELLQGGKSVASVRATLESPVEIVRLAREDFTQLLQESHLTQESVSQIVQQRLAENQSVDSRKKRRGTA